MASPAELLQQHLSLLPTYGQQEAIRALDQFISHSKPGNRDAFLLTGYAGTGKTTLVSALVKTLNQLGWHTVLMAPTGRAAKVMASYSGQIASTIHRHIYTRISADEGLSFFRRKNLLDRAFYIVDEASMISDDPGTGERGLLQDLVDFVYEKKNNRLILIGDTAQLPPVNSPLSPALDQDELQLRYRLNVQTICLTEVVRQAQASGILDNATSLRMLINRKPPQVRLKSNGYKDVYRMTVEKLEEGLRYAYDKYGRENVVVITRSNKAATMYNKFIRHQIEFYEDEIVAGDTIMIVKNNYVVLPEDSKAGFLANGDFAQVLKVINLEDAHGFRFADLELQLLDESCPEKFEARVMLDTLHSAEPNLSRDDWKKLQTSVLIDLERKFTSKKMLMEESKKDSCLNALQVKFAYALTCHKSQGGQWDAVFVDQGFLPEEGVTKDYLRWLYTGVTRASKELFLVNFNSEFFVP